MPSLSFSNKLRYLDKTYLFQTTLNELENFVVCSLFNNGKLINSNTVNLPDEAGKNNISEHVRNIHDRGYSDYGSLFKIIEAKKGSGRAEDIIKLGSTLHSRKLYDEALELLSTAADFHTENSAIRMLLGKIYLSKGEFDKARFEFIKAVDLSPEYPDFRNLLGHANLKLNRPVDAIRQFKIAIDLNVYYDKAHFNLGLGYILNGIVKEDFELARELQKNSKESFEKALIFNPGYFCEKYKLGMELLSQDRLNEAYDKLSVVADEEISSDPGAKLVELYLRFVYGSNGSSEDGIKNYINKTKDLLKTYPGYADLQNELGIAYSIMGKFMRDRAIDHFNKATEINPRFKKAIRNAKLSENDLKGLEVLLEAILK